MVDVTTYSEARQNLAKLMDRVVKSGEPIIVARKKRGSVVLVSLDDWNSTEETMHLFSTRANAKALLKAMDDLDAGKGMEMTMGELRAYTAAVQRGEKPRRPGHARRRLGGVRRLARALHREAAE